MTTDPAADQGSEARGHPFRRVVLVGFMGSGKTTVGRQLAKALGWRFEDLDKVIEARVGRTIPEIFREEGEGTFREWENQAARDLLAQNELVLASGGGWPCREGRMESLDDETLSIWLQVPAEVIGRRTRGRRSDRPLLDVARPRERIQELLAAREPYYAGARWWVDAGNRSPREVVRLVTEHLKSDPERPLRA